MKHPADYQGKQVVILGLARSGLSAAKLFHKLGAHVTVNDKKQRDLCPEADFLEAMGISVICGEHPESLIHSDVALVVKNPGIPYRIRPIEQAIELGIDVVTEVEVAYKISQCPIIGITGSNGKTTTTTWIYDMLKSGGQKPIVAGNIGRPLIDAALEAQEDNWLVVELSSFQLKGIQRFQPHIGCLLNIYETHLDYHGTMGDYKASKIKMFSNQTADNIAVFNWDDAICRKAASEVASQVLYFSSKERLVNGVCVEENPQGTFQIVYRKQGESEVVCSVSELGIPGKHNLENALAASTVALAAGVDIPIIAEVLKGFKGVEHRTEFVAEKSGVKFYNDSKATNAAATIKAIEGFTAPVILIAGGLDRGSDYMELKDYFQSHIKAVITLGETSEKLQHVAKLAGLTLIDQAAGHDSAKETLREAVEKAYRHAESGDVVLLSPACASWDMFSSYEERGRMFKESVHNL
jgi:UDP-N-acetylmuramoylalanine--D-glutamate ligase